MFSSTREPHTLVEALDDNTWLALMQQKYDALMTNRTGVWFPLVQIGISLTVSGFTT
jgi:hypothetical protein